MNKIFCFGEILFRMSPRLNGEWIRQNNIPTYIGGAELNVATALAKWNTPVKYFSAVPDNYLSEEIIASLKQKNIDTSAIVRSGNRIGIYYLPQGTDLKHAGTMYDRSHSSFSELKPGSIDWDKTLEGCSWFHFSAITPALNENMVALCKEALQAAKAKGLTVSIDLNHRSKLWQYSKQPAEVMPELLPYCDVVMGNTWAAESLLGISSSIADSNGKTKEELTGAAGESMKAMHLLYPTVQTMAFTFRLNEKYFAVLQHENEMVVSKEFILNNIVDKVGTGDCFMAGLIYGLHNNHTAEDIINFASAAAVGKMSVEGDSTIQSITDIQTIVNNGKN